MVPDDVRAMMLDQTGSLKYDLLRRDERAGEDVTNAAVQAVVARAGGLPLYVRLVIQDVLADEVRFSDLEHHLPPSLGAYYERLLQRYAVSDLNAVLAPLVTIMAWARLLDEDTLVELLAARGLGDRDLVRHGLSAARGLLRATPVAGSGRIGYTPAHLTVRMHLQTAPSLRLNNAAAREAFVHLVRGWRQWPTDHPAREYVFRHGAATLVETGAFAQLAELSRDRFVMASAEVLGGYEALSQARTVVVALAEAREPEALAAYARGYCELAELVRHEPLDLERLFGAGRSGRPWPGSTRKRTRFGRRCSA